MASTQLLPMSIDDSAQYDSDTASVHSVIGRLKHRRSARRGGILVVLLTAVILLLYLLVPAKHEAPIVESASETKPVAVKPSFTSEGGAEPAWLADARVFASNRSSIYSAADFTTNALKTNSLKPVSAILLAWKRMDSLRFIAGFISKYPFIKEIIIWNNSDDIHLSVKDFSMAVSNRTDLTMRVYNSAANLHDLGKHMACGSLASFDTCYLQDDDWLPLQLDSLYSSYLRDPQRIHTNTMPMIHIEHRRWTFTDPNVGLHTGFAWLGCGSFMPRSITRRFLEHVAQQGLNLEQTRVVDMYFTIFANRYVVQFVNKLFPLDQQFGWSERPDQWNIVYTNMMDAAKRMRKGLADRSWDKGIMADAGASNVEPDEISLFQEQTLRYVVRSSGYRILILI